MDSQPRAGSVHAAALAELAQFELMLADRARHVAMVMAAIDRGEDIGAIRRDEPCVTFWIGTKADLIAADVCAEEHFPVAPRRGKSNGSGSSDRPHIEHWSTKSLRRGYFEHAVNWDRETQARIERELRSHGAAQETPKVTDPEQFADECESLFMKVHSALIDTISGRFTTCVYDAKTVAKVTAALEHARQILQSGTPTVARAVASQEKRAVAAKADASFGRFMQAAFAAPRVAKAPKRWKPDA